MKHWKLIFAGLAFFAAAILYIKSLVAPTPPPVETTQPVIAVSFYPLEYLLTNLVEGDYEVYSVISSGIEPHDFEPSPQDIVRLQEADVFFYNGLDFEPWVERIKPTLEEHGVTLVNAGELLGLGAQTDASVDPHVWLDPKAFGDLADEIKDELVRLYPQDANTFQENSRGLQADIAALYARYKQRLANCELNEIIVSHDAFGYLAKQFGFTVIPIAGFSPQEQPSAKRLGELATLAKQKGITTIFFETLVSPKLSETLAAEIGAKTAVLDPIEGLSPADRAQGLDYVLVMESNLEALATAMQCR